MYRGSALLWYLQTMQLVEIDTTQKIFRYLTDLMNLCKIAENDNLPACENMKLANWEINSSSLLYLLVHEKRFMRPGGCFDVVYNNNKIVACSGTYVSDFSKDIIIGGTRAYTVPEFRTKYLHGNLIFPKQIQWAKDIGAKMFLLTFNSYNDWLYKFIVRGISGKGTAFGLKFSDTYKHFKLHNKEVLIKNTPQIILKLYLDEEYEYDFQNIEYTNPGK